ncbi:MAG: hypothetical protein AAF557_00880 [Pseudomonadota bacterium]
MSFSIYTSCSINYLPKARALAESLRRHQPDARLTLCLNDVVPEWLNLENEPFDRIWLPEDLGYDRSWIFQHNVMELCTAVKGRALMKLLQEEDSDLHLYLDPDVYLFHPLEPIKTYMQGKSIGLIPHILQPEETDIGIRLTEMSVTEHGIYNLGHLIVRPDKNGRAFASWWANRLDRFCFDDRERGLFTDQRWIDLVPTIFDSVSILRVPNVDVASWNLFGRKIRQNQPGDATSFTVDDQPLITYHFSGTGPTGTHRRIREIFDAGNGATAEIERIYEAAIGRHGQAGLGERASGFDRFDDGTPISHQARKLYRDHKDLQKAFPDPFAESASRLTYQRWLRMNRPSVINGLCIEANRLNQAFDDLFDQDYYLSAHPDAAAAIDAGRYASAIDHYSQVGSQLFLDPNEFFVSSFYHDRACNYDRHLLRKNAGTKQGTLLWHYLVSGLLNGVEPIEFFDSNHYLTRNPDLLTAFRLGQISTPLAHFLKHGSREGRDPGPDFNASAYLERNPRARDLADVKEIRGGFGAFVRLGGVAGRVVA